jgi:hypothetical protein
VPEQPSNGNGSPLRRRVPGNQLPTETSRPMPAGPPTADDAFAARDAFDAYEAGVTRAQWEALEADVASAPVADPARLTRRVPGASLPESTTAAAPAPATFGQPMDPDAARAMVEQFEYGVSLALSETQAQQEGQPR